MLKKYMEQTTGVTKLDKKIKDKFTSYMRNIEFQGDNLDFLHGGTLGDIRIKFEKHQEAELGDLFTKVGMIEFKRGLDELDCIEKDFIVTSNPIYHICMYYIHLAIKEGDDKIGLTIFNIMCFRIISSLTISKKRFGTYLTPKPVAKAAFEELSYKYKIKSLGSWYKYFEYRYTNLSKGGKWYGVMKRYECDTLLRALGDTQDKIRKTVNLFTGVIHGVNDNNNAIYNLSMDMKDKEGNIRIKDITNEDIEKSVGNTTVNIQVAKLVSNIMKCDRDDLEEGLQKVIDSKDKVELLTDVVNYTHNVIYNKFGVESQPLDVYIVVIKKYYNSSGMTKENAKLKKKILKIVKDNKIVVPVILYNFILSKI